LKAKKENEEISFEDYLKKLEEIVQQLEEGELTLDESVRLYEEGMNISRLCLEKLNQAKQKIEELVIENGDKCSVRPFSINNKGEGLINGF